MRFLSKTKLHSLPLEDLMLIKKQMLYRFSNGIGSRELRNELLDLLGVLDNRSRIEDAPQEIMV